MNRNTIWGTIAVGLLLILGGLASQQEAVEIDSTNKIKDKSHILLPGNRAIPEQGTFNNNFVSSDREAWAEPNRPQGGSEVNPIADPK